MNVKVFTDLLIQSPLCVPFLINDDCFIATRRTILQTKMLLLSKMQKNLKGSTILGMLPSDALYWRRFQEAGGTQIQGFSRVVSDSIRRRDERRSQARIRHKQQKEEERVAF